MHADIFKANGKHHLVTTDEFAGWPSLAHIHNMTSHTLINSFHTIFLATGVPNTLQQDNAPQFVSHQFRTFLAEWGRLLEPSSPLLSRSNGRAEAAVEAMKKLVLGALHDPDAISYGILAFRKTPRYGGQSPAELIFGQNVREALPMRPMAHDPQWRRPIRELGEIA
ncbi:uncharacterized protein K02A2.6-like [Tigriopus californicus]|uniref:uncharacterized protein K02A2.6-like n=1 Tax=Tigriopus californicus TaxID=6832 RepID=UPI0027DA7E1F|nr:uncharacterized protein K02A2.6-like [Tigriopus californicus]